jgi:HEAT repeat protein
MSWAPRQNFAPGGTWELWWELNRETYLREKHRSAGCVSFLKPWPAVELTNKQLDLLGPSNKLIVDEVLPALIKALRDQREREQASPDIVSSSLLALAKYREEGRPDVRQEILPFVVRGEPLVQEAAVIALGILRDERNVPLLAALLFDDDHALRAQGIQLCAPLSERTRACAALALGETSYQVKPECVVEIVGALVRGLESSARTAPTCDFQVACLTALGLSRLPIDERLAFAESTRSNMDRLTCRQDEVLWLLSYLERAGGSDLERAQVPIAIARLLDDTGDHDSLREHAALCLIAHLEPGAAVGRALQTSCIQALGTLGAGTGEPIAARIRASLLQLAASEQDEATCIAMIALAQVAARRGSDPARDLELSERARSARDFLIGTLRSESAPRRSWAALALGVLERELANGKGEAAPESRAALLEALSSAVEPEEFEPLALAIGLAGLTSAKEELRARLSRSGSARVCGSAALALGLIQDQDASTQILERLRRFKFPPDFVVPAAEGLSLIGDRTVVQECVTALGRVWGRAPQTAVSAALGRLADGRSLASLIDLLEDEEQTDRARGLAAAAIGDIIQSESVSWHERIAVGCNFCVPAPILCSPARWSGVLDVLR